MSLLSSRIFQMNKTEIHRWIFGVLIGSAPFLVIILCWIIISMCTNHFFRSYKRIQQRRFTETPNDTTPVINMV